MDYWVFDDILPRASTPLPLRLAIKMDTDPSRPSDPFTMETQLTITNSSNSLQTGVTIELLYPAYLESLNHSSISDMGTCAINLGSSAQATSCQYERLL